MLQRIACNIAGPDASERPATGPAHVAAIGNDADRPKSPLPVAPRRDIVAVGGYHMPSRKTARSPISKPGEKAVRRTSKEIPVKSPRRSREAAKSPPLPAVDQRDQISGTDELAARRRRAN